MKQLFLIVFFINTSIHSSMYIAAKVTFTYFAHYMPSHELFIQKSFVPDCPVNLLEESYCVAMQCNVIDNSEGILSLNIKQDDNQNMQAIIPLYWGKEAKYGDDFMNVSCSVYKLINS